MLVWIPTLTMALCYGMILFRLRQSSKKFPYLSEESRLARTRGEVVKKLCLLLFVQFVCWFPWQFFTLYDYFFPFDSDSNVTI